MESEEIEHLFKWRKCRIQDSVANLLASSVLSQKGNRSGPNENHVHILARYFIISDQ